MPAAGALAPLMPAKSTWPHCPAKSFSSCQVVILAKYNYYTHNSMSYDYKHTK